MSTHFTLVSLLKQGSRKTNSFGNHVLRHHVRSFIKPAGIFRPVNQHTSVKQLLKPFIQHGRRAAPIFYQQKHWTSTVSSATTPTKKTEERIIYNNWLDHLPPKIAPYAFLTRIDKPIGTWLLFWPCGKNLFIYIYIY
jgi:hypothetical protein